MYILTERIAGAYPQNDDPMAQAFAKHSAIFDLRDTEADNVIVATVDAMWSKSGYKAIRAMQARLNTARYVNGIC